MTQSKLAMSELRGAEAPTHTGTLAETIAERALSHADRDYNEIDFWGAHTATPIRDLLRHALRLVPRLGGSHAPIVIFADRAQDYVPAAWAGVFCGRTILPVRYQPSGGESTAVLARLAELAGRLDRPTLMASQHLIDEFALGTHPAFTMTVEIGDHPADPTAPAGLAESVRASIVDAPADAAFLIQTSGTSGTPKLVEIPYDHMVTRWHERQVSFGDNAVLSPRSWDTGAAQFHRLFCFPQGGIMFDPDRGFADPLGMLRALARHRIPCLTAPNSFFSKLVTLFESNQADPTSFDLSGVQSIRCGGELIAPELLLRARDLFRSMGATEVCIELAYGSTELGRVTDHRVDTLPLSETICLGMPRPGVEIRIADSLGAVVRKGQTGQIEVRYQGMLAGYFGDKEATDAVFTADGFYRTGDLGFIDERGLTIVGRVSGMIIVNGRNVSLAQLDLRLADLPVVANRHIATAAVRSATSTTDELAVFVAPSPEWGENGADLLRARCAEAGVSARWIVPVTEADFVFTRTGKVDRKPLADRFQQGELVALEAAELAPETTPPAAAPAPRHDSGSSRWLAAQWAHILGIDPETAHHRSFFAAGGDSLKFAELVISIENELGCQIPLQSFFQAPTLTNLIELVELEQQPGATPNERHASMSGPEVMRRLEAAVATWPGERAFPAGLIIGHNLAGKRPPLAWVFQQHAELTVLAQALGPDQPIYGMRSLDRIVHYTAITPEVLEAVSMRYLAELLSLRLPAPLPLGGNCSGGIVALALARKLRQFGRPATPLVLLNWQFSFGMFDGDVELWQGTDGDPAFALTHVGGEPLDWQAHFPNARTKVMPGKHAHYFEPAPLAAWAQALRGLTEPAS